MQHLKELAKAHLSFFCEKITNRCVGSKGNLSATDFFGKQLESSNWQIERQAFEAFDWESEYACIDTGELVLKAFSSPYSNSCNLKSEVEIVSTLEELKKTDAAHKILIVKGALAIEQLMPKNFVFYNPDHHKNIIASLENSRAQAFIFIVGKSGFCEGGEYPFPIIEDGDFMVPSVFISEEDGEQLLLRKPKRLKLISRTKKTPSKGYNVIGRRGNRNGKRITITAHIDAKKGSPGAIDNGTGVVAMILLSELLKDYTGKYQIELVALNGEDYYSVPGQMTYLKNNKDNFSDIALNINIDGAGLNKGKTAYTLINLPDARTDYVRDVFKHFPGFVEGKPWVQGDHSMFLQFGVPAIAISSEWLLDNLQTQRITHTENDTVSRVDLDKVIELGNAICTLICKL